MNSEKLLNDIIIWENKILSYQEKQDIIKEILKRKNYLIHANEIFEEDYLASLDDKNLVWVLYHMDILFATKYFSKKSKTIKIN